MMKVLTIVFLVVVVIYSVPHTAHAVPPLDFGGRVLSIVPCVNGLWVIIGPPVPGSYFYVYGVSGLKLNGPPTHPGQLVLGQSLGFMVCLIPCPIGVCPIGGGFMVLPNAGSSAI